MDGDSRSRESKRPSAPPSTKVSWRRRARALYLRIRHEHASPRHVAEAVSLGAFIGCSPFFGLHGWLALGAATVLKRSRLFAFVGSRVCVFFIMPWIVLVEIQSVHRIRTGEFVPASKETILGQAPHLLLDWILGWFLIGIPLSFLLGLLAYAWAKRRDARDARDAQDADGAINQRSTSRPPPPSSEPPPSGSEVPHP